MTKTKTINYELEQKIKQFNLLQLSRAAKYVYSWNCKCNLYIVHIHAVTVVVLDYNIGVYPPVSIMCARLTQLYAPRPHFDED